MSVSGLLVNLLTISSISNLKQANKHANEVIQIKTLGCGEKDASLFFCELIVGNLATLRNIKGQKELSYQRIQ